MKKEKNMHPQKKRMNEAINLLKKKRIVRFKEEFYDVFGKSRSTFTSWFGKSSLKPIPASGLETVCTQNFGTAEEPIYISSIRIITGEGEILISEMDFGKV